MPGLFICLDFLCLLTVLNCLCVFLEHVNQPVFLSFFSSSCSFINILSYLVFFYLYIYFYSFLCSFKLHFSQFSYVHLSNYYSFICVNVALYDSFILV